MNRLYLAALVLGFGGMQADAATLRTMTTLHAPVVLLSDLFDDAGPNAPRVLGPGPGAGGRIVVEAAQLGAIARQFGVDWRPASSADRAVLDRPGRPLRRDDVLDALRIALVGTGASTDCDIELAGFTPPLVPFESDPQPAVSDLDYDANAGRFSAVLSVTGTGMDPIHLRVAGRVDDTVELPVSTTRLPAGSVLRVDDVHIARIHMTLVRGEVARRPGDAVGMQLKRQIAPGMPLPLAEMTRPSLVQKGATVLMALDSPGIALTAQGQALEPGAIGERIRVLNPMSHAVVEAEVIGPDRVRVAPGATPIRKSER
ncbi:MAG TPA: flagellar basal body P-ring formation chaperone FlgA [Acetobacteraceae bacterium]|nr:flagellar basal body P-ring formation chaperone FlgA [Acetobacteraceae bacterium]